MAELAGAVGNIAVNTANVSPEMKQVVDTYNLAMGVIGLKNIGQGSYEFARKLPEQTKKLLQESKSLRSELIARYLDYRTAITKLKNSDEWGKLSPQTRQEFITQEKTFIELADAKNIPNDKWGVKGVFINGQTSEDILSIPKGQRPAPETYLSASYIREHLEKFEKEGGAFIVVKKWIENGNYKEFPLKKFVMLNEDMNSVIKEYKRTKDISVIEKALGYNTGDLRGLENELYLFRTDNSVFNFEIPNGNEIGANNLWIPGGKTSGGYREAVLLNKSNSFTPITHNQSVEFLKNQFKWEKITNF